MRVKSRKSLAVGLVATLAALHTVLSFIPGVWRRWSIVLIPLEGFIGGPIAGFGAALIGSLAGRLLKPDPVLFENLFGLAEAFGALTSGLMVKSRWKPVLAGYAGLLAAFIASPNTRSIPLWTLWDVYLAAVLVAPAALCTGRMIRGEQRFLPPSVTLLSFVAVEFDVLVRIIMFVPLGLFTLYPIPISLLPEIFIAGAFTTPIEALYAVAVNAIISVPVLLILRRGKILAWPLT
ncbi:MAG: hypothetical protein QW390_00715 [Candidatus Bathyarchaeia archaeon]